jgi:hypothetical protein
VITLPRLFRSLDRPRVRLPLRWRRPLLPRRPLVRTELAHLQHDPATGHLVHHPGNKHLVRAVACEPYVGLCPGPASPYTPTAIPGINCESYVEDVNCDFNNEIDLVFIQPAPAQYALTFTGLPAAPWICDLDEPFGARRSIRVTANLNQTVMLSDADFDPIRSAYVKEIIIPNAAIWYEHLLYDNGGMSATGYDHTAPAGQVITYAQDSVSPGHPPADYQTTSWDAFIRIIIVITNGYFEAVISVECPSLPPSNRRSGPYSGADGPNVAFQWVFATISFYCCDQIRSSPNYFTGCGLVVPVLASNPDGSCPAPEFFTTGGTTQALTGAGLLTAAPT